MHEKSLHELDVARRAAVDAEATANAAVQAQRELEVRLEAAEASVRDAKSVAWESETRCTIANARARAAEDQSTQKVSAAYFLILGSILTRFKGSQRRGSVTHER